MGEGLLLKGLAGGNPLGFLAALGVSVTGRAFCPGLRMTWTVAEGGWRPVVTGFDGGEEQFAGAIHAALSATSPVPFEIDKRLPFSRSVFFSALFREVHHATAARRRNADILAGLGSDTHQDEKGNFADTGFRMVRSGDAAGQGLLAYAMSIRQNTTVECLRRALFIPWDYQDEDFSLRWDPVEDQRYALRWYDPSPQSNKKYGLRTMRGANALALEALALLPVQPQSHGAATTGIARLEGRRDYFTWAIWDAPLTLDVIRSLLGMAELSMTTPNREVLRARGIVEVYRCERIAPNQYYKNFSPARPA